MDDLEEIKKTIKESIKTELGSYKISNEQHYQDHIWLSEWRKWQDSIKSVFWKTLVGLGITAILALLLYGFIFFGKANFGGKYN